jgi:hypothetical protein
LAQFGAEVVCVLGIAEQEFLELLRRENFLKFCSGLLAQPGQLDRVRIFALAPLFIDIGLQPVLHGDVDFLNALFGFGW